MGAQWLTVIYGLLTCFGGGVLAFLGISEVAGLAPKTRKAAAVAAALLLLAGGCVFVFSLGRPSAAFAVATNAVKCSPKSLEFVCMLVCLVAAIAYLVVVIRGDGESSAATKGLGIAGIVLGLAMGVLAGHSAAVGRASWCGVVLPIAYLGTGLAMGGALVASLAAVMRETADDFCKLARLALVGAVIQAVGFAVFVVAAGFAVDVVVFWVGAAAVGTVVPLICLAAAPKARALVFASLICSAVGAVCIRLAVYALGTTSLGLIANAASRTAL